MPPVVLALVLFLLTSFCTENGQASQIVLIPASGDHLALYASLDKTFPADRLSVASAPKDGEEIDALSVRYLNSKEANVVLVAWLELVHDRTFIRLSWRSQVKDGIHALEVENRLLATDLVAKRLASAYFETLDQLLEKVGNRASSAPSSQTADPTSTLPQDAFSAQRSTTRAGERPGSTASKKTLTWTTHVFTGVNANYDQTLKTRAVPHFGFAASVGRKRFRTRFGMGVHVGIPKRVRIDSITLSSAERGVFALLGFGGAFGKWELGTHFEVRGSEFSVEAKGAGSAPRQAAPILTPYTGATLGYDLTNSLTIRAFAGAEYLFNRPMILARGREIARPAAIRPELSLRLSLRFGK